MGACELACIPAGLHVGGCPNADDRPTLLDRVEAAHWARDAGHHLISYANAITSKDLHPTYEAACADLDDAVATIEKARRALRGVHTLPSASLFRDFGKDSAERKPDTRPVLERQPDRGA